MTGPAETFAAAHLELDRFGNAIVEGANPAPRLTIDTIIALRAILTRHAPTEYGDCQYCRDSSEDPIPAPCPDAEDVLKVLALDGDPDDLDDRTEF